VTAYAALMEPSIQSYTVIKEEKEKEKKKLHCEYSSENQVPKSKTVSLGESVVFLEVRVGQT
jgi:hypothetical protein